MTPTWQTPDGSIRLYLGDCRDVLDTLEPSGVDAVVTSPPYSKQRTYGSEVGIDWDGIMDSLLELVCAADNCQLLINLGLIHKDGECVPYWEPWRERMRASGWRFFGWYVWDQTFGLPGDWNGRLGPSHEFVFHFNKKSKKVNKTTPTKVRRIVNGTGLRKPDGTTTPRKSHHGRPTQPFKIPDSVIRVCREAERTIPHPAKFPVAFGQSLITSFSTVGEAIADPFMGSGTTGIACIRTGRRFIGIEKEPKYFDIAVARIQAELAKRPLLEGVA